LGFGWTVRIEINRFAALLQSFGPTDYGFVGALGAMLSLFATRPSDYDVDVIVSC
jgi:hypothetical protein